MTTNKPTDQESTAPISTGRAVRYGKPFGQRPLRLWQVWGLRIGVLVAILVAWEIYGQGVSRALFAPPSEIVQSFWEIYVEDPVMIEAIGQTLVALVSGLAIAIVLGVVIGIFMGLSKRFEWVVGPYMSFLFAIPSIALMPLLVVWFGIDLRLRIFLVVVSAIFPVILNTAVGIRQAGAELVEVAESFVAGPWRTLATVRFPASLPFVFAGISLALSLALAGVVVAEMTAAITGLGGLIVTFANMYQTANLFVPILTLMAASVGITALISWVERAVMPWRKYDMQTS